MVESQQHARASEKAQRIADRLVAHFPSVRAIILCGSVARGDSDAFSDLDLVVIGADHHLTPKKLAAHVTDLHDRVSVMYYTTREFDQMLRQKTLFGMHLKEEGVVLFDRTGIQKALATLSITLEDLNNQIRLEAGKLSVYSDSRRFHDNFLFCLSHLYSIGKAIVMLSLAKRGILQFNRDTAFEQLAAMSPDLEPEIRKVAGLRAFYRLVTDRHPEQLPFSYRSAAEEMKEAVCAIQKLAKRAEGC